MARKIAGEASLKVGARTVRLRLTIGAMLELEDYFEMGLVPFLSERLPQFRLKDMAVLYAAMTKMDFHDDEILAKAAETIVKTGLKESAEAISKCLEATLSPEATGKAPGK